jgi:hypothetical protein
MLENHAWMLTDKTTGKEYLVLLVGQNVTVTPMQ